MGFGSILLSGRFSAPKAIKRACRLVALAALALCFVPGRAAAQTTTISSCPGTITGSVTLGNPITVPSGWTGPCITVGASGLTVNLSGLTIDLSQVGNTGVAIDAGSYDNTTIVSGTIITNYTDGTATAAVTSEGGANLTITGLSIYNEANSSATPSLCANPSSGTPGSQQPTEYGTGISVTGVTGATIGSNNVCFYQYGISVQGSPIPSTSTGSISGNTLNWDTYYMNGTGTETYSAGLILSNSSGWSVSGNTILFDGAISPSGQCLSPTSTTAINTCSFGLQIVNGASANAISSNTVDSNFIGGIYTGPDTSGNSITLNTALSNFGYDIWDDAPSHSNSWHRNTCSIAGGTLNPHSCHN